MIPRQKILHVITGLNDGGAEGVLARLCLNDRDYIHIVVSLMDMGKHGPILKKNGIEVCCIGLRRGQINLGSIFSLLQIIKKYRPDVVQTWMYHADLLGGICAKMAGVERIIWNIRSSDLHSTKSKRATKITAWVCAILSYFIPNRIICCSDSAKVYHLSMGYRNIITVIPNGIDILHFASNGVSPDERHRLGLSLVGDVIGMVARYDPQKDHSNLLRALSLVASSGYDFTCLLVGNGLDQNNLKLKHEVLLLGLESKVRFLGPIMDVKPIMSVLDVHILSSAYGEAFPNVVAESMSCGVPNVVTNVGDSALIVGDVGLVVDPEESELLASGIIELLEIKRQCVLRWEELRSLASARIRNEFSLSAMIENYHRVWR